MSDQMTIFFQKRFEEEVLLSERLRTKILAGMFLFAMLYTGIVMLYFHDKLPSELRKGAAIRVFVFVCTVFVFEVICYFFINRHIKRNFQKIPVIGQYINAFVEITAPSVIMLLLPGHVHSEKVL